jgi:hypothetical protein
VEQRAGSGYGRSDARISRSDTVSGYAVPGSADMQKRCSSRKCSCRIMQFQEVQLQYLELVTKLLVI